MEKSGITRRIAGLFQARLGDFALEDMEEVRGRRGRRWKLPTLLRALLVGLAAGRKNLRQVEDLTADLSLPIRRLLAIPRRIADTTLRDLLVRLSPSSLRERLHAFVRAAHRRKQLEPVGFPFGVVAMDGKRTCIWCWDDRFAQKNAAEDGSQAYGLVTTITCALVSASGTPCIDVIPVPVDTNEMGVFRPAFQSLNRHHGALFQMATYDAGANSAENAQEVVDAGKYYLFAQKNDRRLLTQDAIRKLGGLPNERAQAHTEDVASKEDDRSVFRYVFLCHVAQAPSYWGMPHVKTIVRVRSETVQQGKLLKSEDRYSISNLPGDKLTPEQWLLLVRSHWGVETCHNTLDKLFREDESPWIDLDAQGALAVLILRRMAYTLLALYRSRTLRSDENRHLPWKRLFELVHNTVIKATADQLADLRLRTTAACC